MIYKDILASKKKYLADLIDAREKGLTNIGTNERIEETEMIIEALEYRIPEKVLVKYSKAGKIVYCPVCDYILSITGDKTGDYCERCGKALDWSKK